MDNNRKDIEKDKLAGFHSRFMALLELYDSQVELSKDSGITPATISAIKKEKILNPSFELLSTLIEGVGCNAQWLLVGEGNVFPEDHPDIYKIKNRAEVRGVYDVLFPEEGKIRVLEDGNISQDEFAGMLENLHGMIGSWISHYRSL